MGLSECICGSNMEYGVLEKLISGGTCRGDIIGIRLVSVYSIFVILSSGEKRFPIL